MRQLVLERDGYRCARCGRHIHNGPYSLQHRKARGMGGTKDPAINSPANLVTLCGDGVRGCHGLIEANREEAREKGFTVRQTQDPSTVPVHCWDGTYYFNQDGGRDHP